MFSTETDTLLHKSLTALSQTPPLIICNRTLHNDIDDLVAMVLPGMRLAIVADANTDFVLGTQVSRALKGQFQCQNILLEGKVVADDETVEYIRRKSSSCDALLAVGSGTINDLCKYAAHLDGKPYIVFPTAASMNGYLSANASIIIEGYKKTCAAKMPIAVFCDLSVIAAAPSRLNKSGLGDSLARPTAQADWLLSHLLIGTPYDETPFTLLAPVEEDLFDNARGIVKGDPKTIELLVSTVLLSGLGMTIAGGSYPASQGEHMIAHTYGMINTAPPLPVLHGEEIGVTSLYMARLQQGMLRGTPALRPLAFDKDAITALVGMKVAEEGKKAYWQKLEAIEKSGLHQDVLKSRWEKIRDSIAAVMMPPEKMEMILSAAETYSSIEALGWPQSNFDTAVAHARFLRERFTFLDIQS